MCISLESGDVTLPAYSVPAVLRAYTGARPGNMDMREKKELPYQPT
jgi:hypothetical protein